MAKYSKKIADKICELVASGKYKLADITEMVGISLQTYFEWKKTKPEFLDKLQEVEQIRLESLREKALSGLAKLLDIYEHEEVKTEYIGAVDEKGNSKPRIKSQTRIKKVFLPNQAAIQFALTNRDASNWKNRNQVDHTNNGGSFDFANFLMSNNTIEDEDTTEEETNSLEGI